MSKVMIPLKPFMYDDNETFEENKETFVKNLSEYEQYHKKELKRTWMFWRKK